MRLSLPDRAACQADSAPESVGGRERDLTTDNVDGHTARRWDLYYAGVDSLEERRIAVASWSWKSIGYAWTQLLDRDYPPRRWWWPGEAEVPLHHDDLQRQHGQCSETTNRLLLTLLGFCFFCWLTLGGSDAALWGAGGEIAVPVVNVSLSKTAFLTVGPLLLIALTVSVHILVERLQR